MDGRPWAHWKGSWQEDKEATRLWHSSLLRLSLNLMAPVKYKYIETRFQCVHLWNHQVIKRRRERSHLTLPWHAREASTFSTVRGRVPLTVPVERSN